MKVIFVLLVSATVVFAYPQFRGNFGFNTNFNNFNVPYITRYDNSVDDRGVYKFLAEGSDGQIREEIGGLKNKGTDQEALVMGGYYSYTGPDGKQYTVSYVADENGFRPSGDHIPMSAGVTRRTNNLGIPSSAVATLAGGGLGK